MVVVVVVVVIVVIVVDTLWNSHANGQSFQKRCTFSYGRGAQPRGRRRSPTSSSCTRGGGSRDGARRGGRPAVGGRAPWAVATGWATVAGRLGGGHICRTGPYVRLELVLTLLTEVEAGERLSARSSCPRAAPHRSGALGGSMRRGAGGAHTRPVPPGRVAPSPRGGWAQAPLCRSQRCRNSVHTKA